MKFYIDIKEIHDATVSVEAPECTSRDLLIRLANQKFEEEGAENTEYNRTMEEDVWTVRDEHGNFIK